MNKELNEIKLDKAITQKLETIELKEKNCTADILRLDLIHEVISGNKWFKLKYYLEEIKKLNNKNVITFGGAYSNHIVATALACKLLGLTSIGIIRGEEPKKLSHTLNDSLNYGMKLHFVSRSEYNQKENIEILKQYSNAYIIPEGGSGELGVEGSGTILDLTDYKKYSHIICSIGTGTMYCGIVNTANENQEIIGIPVLKGMYNLIEEYEPYIKDKNKIKNCIIFPEYHFGGYAKKTNELIDFMNNFYSETKIPTDFVYSAKSIYAFIDLLKKDYFKPQSNILVIHCGGLQGNLSLKDETLIYS
jgi:1-aminocyclopropane-1-carboxylate deaminase